MEKDDIGEEEPEEEEPIEDLEEIIQDIRNQSSQKLKRNRTNDSDIPAKRKNQRTRQVHIMNQESSESSDGGETDDSSNKDRTKRNLNSTPKYIISEEPEEKPPITGAKTIDGTNSNNDRIKMISTLFLSAGDSSNKSTPDCKKTRRNHPRDSRKPCKTSERKESV